MRKREMNFPEWFLEAVRQSAEKYPNDIEKATNRAEGIIRRHEEFSGLVDELVRETILHKVYDSRHSINRTIRQANGQYGGPAPIADLSPSVIAASTSLYLFNIASKSLGELTGAELPAIAKAERAKAAGFRANARLCELLAPLVPKEKTVRQAVSEKKLRELFRKANVGAEKTEKAEKKREPALAGV